ncbi:MAG: hypothetical protein DWI66_02385 [Candidatus Aquidulcis sp.]|nr:MAG: hypothetical protein DWI66_02385 [Candidatus Aquidulcis sp.]
MAKSKSVWLCQTCAFEAPALENPCRSCGSWNSLVETVRDRPSARVRAAGGRTAATPAQPQPLRAASADRAPRLPLGVPELDRVLGGGAVPGSIILLGGEPGIGKSTLLLQAAAGIALAGGRVLYASGEESAAQIADRAERLGLMSTVAADTVEILAESEAGTIAEATQSGRPTLLIVDSIQTATLAELEGPAGSVGQVRGSAEVLASVARATRKCGGSRQRCAGNWGRRDPCWPRHQRGEHRWTKDPRASRRRGGHARWRPPRHPAHAACRQESLRLYR